jgi:AmmeMemoRadiSam system protein B
MSPQTAGAKVRPAAVAGQFYPGDPDRLRRTVRQLLDGAAPATGSAKALIAPHAGYVYSGAVAAAAFAGLAERAPTITRVIVIGPAHYVRLDGIGVTTAQAFETPLGRVPVDAKATGEIARLPAVTQANAAHAPEHALEVELPFLQLTLLEFELVPLLVGEARPQQVADVLAALWGGPETLIVVSSDLSHYHPYEAARRIDAATAAMIEAGQWDGLTPERACGALAIAGLLIEAGRRGLAARRLTLCNSGDTAGPRGGVVGYGAWSFY